MLTKIEIVDLMQNIGHDYEAPHNAALYAKHMSPRLRVLEPGGLPYGGAFEGEKELAEFNRIYHETWASSSHQVLRSVEADNFVICFLEAQFTSRSTGRTLETTVTEWWRLEGEVIVEIDIFYKDVAAVLATISPDRA